MTSVVKIAYIFLASCWLLNCATATSEDPGGGAEVDASISVKIDASQSGCTAPLSSCGELCVNTNSDLQHCGGCDIPCKGECVAGACQILTCDLPTILCDDQCIDPVSDDRYCGASADCLGANAGDECENEDDCVNGMCTCVDCQSVFEESFVQGSDNDAQCASWNTYRTGLDTDFGKVTVYGDNDPTGISCSDPAKVQQIANGLRSGTQFFVSCEGHTWSFCDRLGGEFWVDGPALCDLNNCPDPGYVFRICWGTPYFGGIGTATCTTAPSQTMGLRFE